MKGGEDFVLGGVRTDLVGELLTILLLRGNFVKVEKKGMEKEDTVRITWI